VLWALVAVVLVTNSYLFFAFSRDSLPHTGWMYFLISVFLICYIVFIAYLCVRSKWARIRTVARQGSLRILEWSRSFRMTRSPVVFAAGAEETTPLKPTASD